MKHENNNISINYICTHCGSDNIVTDAWAVWNPETQEMELETTFNDHTHCQECEGECKVKEVPYNAKN